MASKLYLGETHSELVRKFNELVDEFKSYLPLSGGTLTGALTTKDLTLKGIEQFQTHYAKKLIGTLSAGTSYANLDSKYKDGTYHRMWRLRFPASCNFWGKIKITLYGGYSSFNASGIMSKSITCNFNGSSIYNNVGFYDGLGVNVEKDFRISEAIWNSTASAWEILIWQKNLSGNNSPTILLEAWSSSETYLTNAKNITAQAVELTQATTYTASKASSTGGTKTVTWATTPVYQTPLGEEIATMSDIPSVPSVTVTPTLTTGTEIASIKVGSTTTKLYAPTGSVSGNYLPLSGGTMTGDIKFNTGTDDYTKQIGTENGLAYIDFEGKTGSLSLNASGLVGINAESVEIYAGQSDNSITVDQGGVTLWSRNGVISATAPANVSGQEKVTAWFNTANGGRVGFGKEATNSGTGIFFDQVKGTRRLNFCASSTAGEMVWEQPEQGAQLYIDLGKKNADYRRISFPSSGGTLALTSQIKTYTLSSFGITATSAELNYTDGVTSNIQTQLDGKASNTDNPNLTYYATDNGTTTAGTWLGKNDNVTSLFDGLSVNYKVTKAGASTTTFNLNGLGAKTVYLRGTTKLTTHYEVGTIVNMIYNSSTGAWYVADYDANSYAYLRQYYTLTTTDGEYPIIYSYTTDTGTSSYKTAYGAVKGGFTFNPSTDTLSIGDLKIDGGVNLEITGANGVGIKCTSSDAYVNVGDDGYVNIGGYSCVDVTAPSIELNGEVYENGTKLEDKYALKTEIGGSGSTNTKTPYATSSTAAATAAKVATISSNDDNFELAIGQRVLVKFTYANTVASPTLNVNSTGAKTIYTSDYLAITSEKGWTAGDVCEFMYNGTYWIWINSTINAANIQNGTIPAARLPYAAKSTSSSTTAGTKGAVRIRVYNGNLYIHTS